MPGRKSNVSTASNGPEEVPEPVSAKASRERDGISIEDLSLPKSMIARLAKGVLPANTQIHKDALLALHKSATVFVSYIASGANENAIGSGKKTIAPHDVIAALKDSELEAFLPRLEAELKKYNDMQCDKRNTYRRKVKEEKAAAAAKDDDGEGDVAGTSREAEVADAANGVVNGHAEDVGGGERPVKKMKGVNGEALPPNADDEDDVEAGDDHEADEPDHDADDDDDDDVVEDEVDDEEDDVPDESMEDALEEREERSEIIDEALDDPDSD